MNIDFTKLFRLLMPTFLRYNVLQALLNAFAKPFQDLYNAFMSWQNDIRIQAVMTCQVMYLEAMINYRLFSNFLRTVYITDGDGISYDFIINVPAGLTVNSQRLVSIIEQYKLTGKRYSIGQSYITYAISWTDPICELDAVVFTPFWSAPVCEFVSDLVENHATAYISDETDVRVILSSNCTSDLSITLDIGWDSGARISATGTVKQGALEMTLAVDKPNDAAILIADVVITSITPASDDTYLYTY